MVSSSTDFLTPFLSNSHLFLLLLHSLMNFGMAVLVLPTKYMYEIRASFHELYEMIPYSSSESSKEKSSLDMKSLKLPSRK